MECLWPNTVIGDDAIANGVFSSIGVMNDGAFLLNIENQVVKTKLDPSTLDSLPNYCTHLALLPESTCMRSLKFSEYSVKTRFKQRSRRGTCSMKFQLKVGSNSITQPHIVTFSKIVRDSSSAKNGKKSILSRKFTDDQGYVSFRVKKEDFIVKNAQDHTAIFRYGGDETLRSAQYRIEDDPYSPSF
jgi:hypothetical protein